MQKYQCIACGWIYDPADYDNVAFEDQPEDFVCPECGNELEYKDNSVFINKLKEEINFYESDTLSISFEGSSQNSK